jgi:Ala-tRNA(Pro) deacylase
LPARRLKAFLDREAVKYVSVQHSPAYTAQEIAESAQVSGKILAKNVVVWLDGHLAMAVLPAARHLDLDKLRAATGAGEVRLASEEEFRSAFPDCEPGTMPPFGALYEMAVHVDPALLRGPELVFNAGSYTELVQLSTEDYQRLAKPLVMDLSAVA